MSTPPPLLSADTLASELAKLPSLTSPTASHLDAVQIALARAIASGQSADQLAGDLGTPAGWQSVDFSKTASGLRRGTAATPAAAASAAKLPPALPVTPAAWIGKVVPIALAKNITTRVAVLDREPTALGGLERPAWARAQSPSATYGPISVTSANLQVTAQKWIQVFRFTEVVEFVRSGSVLCVVPISIIHLGNPTQVAIFSGSAWIAAQPFASAAPADGFAGIAIKSGELTSDQPLTFSGATVTIPANATVSLSLIPATSPGGPSGFPASVTAPGKISVTFPASGTASISFDHCAAILYGEKIHATHVNVPAAYNPQLKLIYIPGQSSVPLFKPKQAAGKILHLSGSAPIENAGWALSVSESSTPATLGTALNSGDFAFVFGPGLSSKWTGLARPEPTLGGALIAQNNAIILYLFSGAAPGVLAQQVFELWDDQDATGRRCQLVASRAAGQLLMFALTGTEEILELGAALDALVDRPLLATGARVPALFSEGLVALIRNNSGNRLFVYSTTPASNPTGPAGGSPVYPMALDNAFLDVSEPGALLIYAKADAHFNAIEGFFYLLFAYALVELYLPDPYTGGLQAGRTDGPPTSVGTEQGSGGLAGFLIAQVIWPTISTAKLRISDTAHSHPAAPPTTEAGSNPVVPLNMVLPLPPIHLDSEQALATTAAPEAQLAPRAAAEPSGPPLPEPLAGALLLDLSTRASQLGVEVTINERADEQYRIDGLSVRGPASLLPLATLPAIAWEPMYNTSTAVDAGVSDYDLLHPPNDGPVCQVRPTSATLIPISPLQSLQALLNAGTGGFTAQLTLPYGMVGTIDSVAGKGTLLPNVSLVQPVFPASATPSGSVYTGAWQLSFAAPNPNQPDPIFAGHSYLRTQDDNPATGLSYGEQVLGTDVTFIFDSRFNPPVPTPVATPGIPMRRYDLTGYGASTFSEWTNTTPYTTDVIKAFFHVLIGRTSHEVIQVQSIICPWGIKVVRTVTIDRESSGVVQRYDSGWQAASDGLFQYPTTTGITPNEIQAGIIGGVINVKNIQQLGLPVNTEGTEDGTGYGGNPANPLSIPVQPVTFDADVIIQPQHQVTQGGANLKDLTGQMHVCVPSRGVTGFIPLQTGYHLSVSDMANFDALSNGAGGPINATLNVGNSTSLLRATRFDATPILDSAVANGVGIIGALRGVPKLSSDGSWSVGARKQSQAAPVSLPPTQPVPLVQPNKSGQTIPGDDIHFADPEDIFRLAAGSPVPPQTFYGFLQATGTQSNFLSRPVLSYMSDALTLADALNVAHAGALLGAISSFPGISNCLQFLSSEIGPIKNLTGSASLSTIQNLQLSTAVRSKPFPLISTSIADVNLYFYWKGDNPANPPNPATVVIALGQTDPSWSLDINRVAVGLVIPAISGSPILWLEGGFHADADTIPPAFPDLQVVFDGPLQPLTQFFTVLQSLESVLSPGGGAGAEFRRAHDLKAHDDGDDTPGLNVHFSDGKLSVTDNFTLPDIPLGPGTISNVSLDIGTTLNIIGLSIDFLVGIGSPDAPVHWIVDPLSGTICIQAGIQANQMDILIQGGIGLGLAIDLGIASGSASIVIAVRIQVQGSTITLMFLLTGQASVDVLGGLASASITLTAGLGLSFNLSNPADCNLIGTAAVGIHISICWVININFSGSWTFQKEINLAQLT
jgi:hypothetical protein